MVVTRGAHATPSAIRPRWLAGIHPAAMTRLVLASQSPARLNVLRHAGIDPLVRVSDVDEDAIEAAMPGASPAQVCLALARAKAEAVAPAFAHEPATIVIGCDSVFDVDGHAWSKARDEAELRTRWAAMLGRSGTLRTGHWLIDPSTGNAVGDIANTTVHIGRPTPDELDAYVATGEPMRVAGGFTLDGLGGAFVEGIEGDPSNVVGISLPLLRRLLAEMGITWTDLWSPPAP